MQAYTESIRSPVTREMGLSGRLVVGGMVSTGLLLGGYAVAATTLSQGMNANSVLLTSLGLFLVGALAGLVPAAALGWAGREEGVDGEVALWRLAKGVLYAVPACLVGAVLATWIGMATVVLYAGSALPIVLTTVATLAGLAVMAATFGATCRTVRNATRRVLARVEA